MERAAVFFALLLVVDVLGTPPRRLQEHHGLRHPALLAVKAPDLSGKPLKAAEQGFEGQEVQHEDGKTGLGDWQQEYGPKGPQPLHTPEQIEAVRKNSGAVMLRLCPAASALAAVALLY
mmetsp:Transcript_45113/g.79387  ORF Transcript_45113/g.79387 Transcript_45113/m.79387 type:complete len:119 (+) Transcript_45113:102-458(+)